MMTVQLPRLTAGALGRGIRFVAEFGVDSNSVASSPAGGCGCFGMTGGGGWLAFNIRRSLKVVGEVAGNTSGTSRALAPT